MATTSAKLLNWNAPRTLMFQGHRVARTTDRQWLTLNRNVGFPPNRSHSHVSPSRERFIKNVTKALLGQSRDSVGVVDSHSQVQHRYEPSAAPLPQQQLQIPKVRDELDYDLNLNPVIQFYTMKTIRIEFLNDAAIALHRVLARANIRFGIFGGYAISVLGGPRKSKDIDCLASMSKEQAIALLDGQNGFTVIPQSRQDYVAFLWNEPSTKQNAVVIEIFCEQFEGAQYSMNTIQTTLHNLQGARLGTGLSSFLDPIQIFKGKTRAAATRSKSHDPADLTWLADRYGADIQARRAELNPEYTGLALKRYPELTTLFARLGVNVAAARYSVRALSPSNLPPPAPGDVHRGLLA